MFYMWNPSIGFFKRLPNLVLPPETNELINYGVGYFPATDDYRVFVNSFEIENYVEETTLVFTTSSKAWKNHQVKTQGLFEFGLGTFLNEALHWVDRLGGIVAFDLGDEEGKYRDVSSPSFENEDGGGYMHFSCLGVSPGGCLSLVRISKNDAGDYIDLWVLREYNVSDLWTKLVKLSSHSPVRNFLWYYNYGHVMVMAIVMLAKLSTDDRAWAIMVNNIEEVTHEMLKFEKWLDRIHYEETLIQIHD